MLGQMRQRVVIGTSLGSRAVIHWQDVMDAETNEILDDRQLIKVITDLEIGTNVLDSNRR